MIKYNEIKKENISYNPWEHILIDDFVDPYYIKRVYSSYVGDMQILQRFEEFNIVSSHPVQEIISVYDEILLDKINLLWNTKCTQMCISTNMFDNHSELAPHNDYNYDGKFAIPVRGILYIDQEKVFGTQMHTVEDDEGIEVGGNPGQLLLFPVSPVSFHSAGVNVKAHRRFTTNFFFATDDYSSL